MPRHRSRSKSPVQRIRKKGHLTIIEGMYQPTLEEDKKLYDKYKKWISAVEQTAAPPLKHLTTSETELLHKAKKYAMECSVQAVLTKKQGDQFGSMTAEQRQQQRDRAIALMCRVYVGSISYDLNEEDLRKAFAPFGPIKGINLSWDQAALGKSKSHKGYAFLEYNVAESAQLALDQMNGVMLGGKPLKCARPSNIPAALPLIKQITEEASEQPRIFVSSIHQDLSESDIRSVFEAFGTIRGVQLSQDVLPGKHQGFGFLEYETVDAANDSVAAMNLFDLGGQFLRVGRAITPPQTLPEPEPVPPELAAAAAAAGAAAKILAAQDLARASARARHDHHRSSKKHGRHNSRDRRSGRSRSPRDRGSSSSKKDKKKKKEKEEKEEKPVSDDEHLNKKEKAKKTIEGLKGDISISQEEEMSITGSNARFMIMQKLAMKDKESSVMILKNMVAFEDVDEDLEAEIKEECSNYGTVKKVIIYQEAQSEADDAEVLVKIFVQFDKSSESEVAISALNGRWFGGRTIHAALYEEQRFLRDDLSG